MNEAGASIYSASDDAKKEMPDLDINIRGAGRILFISKQLNLMFNLSFLGMAK